MKKFFIIVIVLASLPSWGIAVREQDQEQSLSEAANLHFMCMIIGTHEDGLNRLWGSGSLVCNNEQDGTFCLFAGHSLKDPANGQMRCVSWHVSFDTGVTPTWADRAIEVTGIYFYEREGTLVQDIALVKLEDLVRETDGTITQAIEMYQGPLVANEDNGSVLRFGGYGVSVDPTLADPYLIDPDPFSYKKRVADGRLFSFGVPSTGQDPTFGYMLYDASLSLPGIAAFLDSGGFVAIEDGGKLQMVGLIKAGRRTGIDSWTGFENFQYDNGSGQLFFPWMENTIADNGNTPNTPPVANAGPTQSGYVGQVIYLNGAESSDADGDPLVYEWDIMGQPFEGGAVISDQGATNPTFIAHIAGTYRIQLAVSDGTDVAADEVEIVITASPNLPGPSTPVISLVLLGIALTRVHRSYKRSPSK